MMALDTATGDLIWKVQPDPSSYALMTTSPVVYNGVVYMGVSSAEEDLTTPTLRGSIQTVACPMTASRPPKPWSSCTKIRTENHPSPVTRVTLVVPGKLRDKVRKTQV